MICPHLPHTLKCAFPKDGDIGNSIRASIGPKLLRCRPNKCHPRRSETTLFTYKRLITLCLVRGPYSERTIYRTTAGGSGERELLCDFNIQSNIGRPHLHSFLQVPASTSLEGRRMQWQSVHHSVVSGSKSLCDHCVSFTKNDRLTTR